MKVFVVLFFAAALFSIPSVSVADNSYDFLMIVQSWPKSTCLGRSCPFGIPDHFVIHGLWPSRPDNSYPQMCNTDSFDLASLEPIMTNLLEDWPDLYKNQTGFWQHEWSKHGTCAEDVLPSTFDYFSTSLKLFDQFDLTSIGFQSNNGQPLNYYTAPIKAKLGFDPIIFCVHQGGQQYITQFGLCLSKTTYQAFECDPTVYTDGQCSPDMPAYLP